MKTALLKLQVCIISKNVVSVIVFIVLFLVFVIYAGILPKEENYSLVLSNLYYLEVAIFVICFEKSVFFSIKKATLETCCLVDVQQTRLSRLLALLFSNSIYILLAALYTIIMAVLQGVGFLFWLETLVYISIVWLGVIILSTVFGYFSGIYVKNYIAFILVIPFVILFSFLNKHFFSIFSPLINDAELDALCSVFSCQSVLNNGIQVNYASPRLDLFSIIKFICTILLALMIMSVAFVIDGRKLNIKSTAIVLIFAVLYSFSVSSYIYYSPLQYNPNNKIFSYTSSSTQSASIEEISGQIDLGERIDAEISIQLKINDKISPIVLKLDEQFNLNSIKHNNSIINYTRAGDYLIIQNPQTSDATYTLEYDGRIYYQSADSINLYSSITSTSLPPYFAFVPIIEGDFALKSYDLLIYSNNYNIVSNLECDKLKSSTYHVFGVDNVICIFGGFLNEIEIDGTIFYRPSYSNKDYDAMFQRALSYRYFDSSTMTLSDDDLKEIAKGKKKIFQIYFNYDTGMFPVSYDNFIIIHSGG